MPARGREDDDPQIKAALSELQAMIAAHYPTASFDVFERDDPTGVRLRVTVDVEDTDEVMDLVIELLTEIQTDRQLPVYLVIEQPLTRVAEHLKARGRAERYEPLSSLFR